MKKQKQETHYQCVEHKEKENENRTGMLGNVGPTRAQFPAMYSGYTHKKKTMQTPKRGVLRTSYAMKLSAGISHKYHVDLTCDACSTF